MNCADCENMQIISIEEGCGSAAKCFKKSKAGKTITWAMTSISPDNNWKKTDGKDSVISFLKSKNTVPFWCPIKKCNEIL